MALIGTQSIYFRFSPSVAHLQSCFITKAGGSRTRGKSKALSCLCHQVRKFAKTNGPVPSMPEFIQLDNGSIKPTAEDRDE